MNNPMQQNRLRDVCIASGLSLIILFLGATIFPILMGLFVIPQIVVGYRYGISFGALSMLLALAVLGAVFGIDNIYLIAVFGFACYLSLLKGIREQWDPHKAIFTTAFILMVVFSGYFYLLQARTTTDIFAQAARDMEQAIIMSMGNLEETMNPQQLEQMKDIFQKSMDYIMVGLPGIFFVMSYLTAFINYMVGTYSLCRMGIGCLETARFKEFSLPKNFSGGIFLSLVITWLIGYFGFAYRDEVVFNLIIVYVILLGIQGLAVQDYYLAKRRGIFVRVFLPILMVGIFRAFMLYVIIGIIDLIVNFRKRDKLRGTGGGKA